MQRILHWRCRQTTIVFSLCLAFLLGVGLAHSGQTIGVSLCLLAGIGSLFTLRRKTIWTLGMVVLFGLGLGLLRGHVYMQKLADFDSYYYQKVTLTGTASDDATYGRNTQLTFDSNNVVVAKTGQKLTGKVAVSGFGEPAVFAGDSFTATGKLYPSLGSYQGRISFAELTVTGHSNSLINDLRRRFQAGMQSALPEPLASFGMGLLIGQKANLPDDIYNSLLMVGLVHIIAVSGYNLTIILRASAGLLKKRSKRLSTLLALGLIVVFLLFAGTSSSIVRAAVVSVLSVGATYYGRNIKPIVLILLAAAITAWARPFYVWSDVSWYLSFLAFFGVMVVAPLVLTRLPRRLQGSLIVTIATESFCAELMTLPYVLHVFGQMSFVALIANVLVVALVPLAMLLCLIAGLAGMLLPAVAGWLAWPARLLLTYMLDIAGMLSRIPHIFVQNLSLPLTQLLLLYGVLGFVVYLLYRHILTRKLHSPQQQTNRETITIDETAQ